MHIFNTLRLISARKKKLLRKIPSTFLFEFSWILSNHGFYGNRRNSGLALHMKMLVLVTTINMPNFMLASKRTQFTRNFGLRRLTAGICFTNGGPCFSVIFYLWSGNWTRLVFENFFFRKNMTLSLNESNNTIWFFNRFFKVNLPNPSILEKVIRKKELWVVFACISNVRLTEWSSKTGYDYDVHVLVINYIQPNFALWTPCYNGHLNKTDSS